MGGREGGRQEGREKGCEPGVDRREESVSKSSVKTNREFRVRESLLRAQVTPEFNWLLICAERLTGFPPYRRSLLPLV